MEKIQINRKLTEIQVNEAGETITLDFDDQEFISRLVNTVKAVEVEAKELRDKHGDSNNLEAVAKASLELCRKWKSTVDDLIGEGTCKKVFGDITPGVAAFADFFAQLGDIVGSEQWARSMEQNERIKKYTDKYKKYHDEAREGAKKEG